MSTDFVSHYRVVRKLGSGGMADVYLAEDEKLDRTVALKMLSASLTENPELRQRLVREAKAASALSHPNLAHVYEIGESDGAIYIAMEYVQGETLTQISSRGALEPAECLDIGLQIAEALAEAHARGVVHRDIKPGNLILTPKGRIKVLDFGLAKTMTPPVDAVRSDFDTVQKSSPGALIGTVPYMSPEQARGEEVDVRTDIFSLGVVLYELVTGTHPFQGSTSATVFDAILNKKPSLASSLNRRISPELDAALAKALEKERALRHPTIADFRNDLWRAKRNSDIERLPVSEDSPAAGKPPRSRARTVLAAVALGTLALLGMRLTYHLGTRSGTANPIATLRVTPLTGGVGFSSSPSWSPDGEWVVYSASASGRMEIWKVPVSRSAPPVRLTESKHNDVYPSWSPDGRSVAFAREGSERGIFLIPAAGGTAFELVPFGTRPKWSPNAASIAFESNGTLYTVPSGGGPPSPVVRGLQGAAHAAWGPDGSSMMYWDFGANDLHVVSAEGGDSKPLNLIPAGQEVAGLSWSSDGGTIVYSSGPFGGSKDLWIADYDARRAAVRGEPRKLLSSLTDDIESVLSPDGERLVFTARHLERQLFRLQRDPRTGRVTGEPERIPSQGNRDYYPGISPDGRRLVWTSHRGNQGALYIKDLERDDLPAEKLTQDWGPATREVGAYFSPDGEQLSYSSTVGGSYQLWRLPALGSIALQVSEARHPISDNFPAWSPAGDTLIAYSNRAGSWDIWAFDVERRREPRRLTGAETSDTLPVWSPDGRYIAYLSDGDESLDIWRMDASGNHREPYVSSSAEEGWSSWSPDGRFFYFTSNRTGPFNIWLRAGGPESAVAITDYFDPAFGLPESSVFTRFAVSDNALIVPLESREGDIHVVELGSDVARR